MSKEKKREKRVRKTAIGGQAVMEGVMMRGVSSMAVSVRDADGCIRTQSSRVKPTKERNLFFRLPVVRGVVNFVSMLISGVQIIMQSAEVYAEEELADAEKKAEKKREKKQGKAKEKKEDAGMGAMMALSVILGLVLAIGLFFVLPMIITKYALPPDWNPIYVNLIEGGIRFAVFIGYLLLVSLLKDIRRTFMYHGAEHRTINCYESGMEMTVENVQKCSTVHQRCGTTFIFFVLLMSIIIFALFDGLLAYYGKGDFLDNIFFKILTKLALLPLVAGLSYELLKGLARTDFWLFWPLKAPGMLLQKITTKKPTDDMAEVALASFNTVLEMDADRSLPPKKFAKPELTVNLRERVKRKLAEGGVTDEAETDWIFCKALGCRRNEIVRRERVTVDEVKRIEGYTAARLTGKPLQYVLGETEFYGATLKCDARALIPRFETELLAEQAALAMGGKSSLLDLCTGSGAIAVSVAKKLPGITVTAADISAGALALAAENAEANGAAVEFVESDLFERLAGRKFGVIVSNPPYIPEGDIAGLAREVKDYEPRQALAAGADGLDFYRRIAQEAFAFLKPGGALLLEVGITQAERVAALFEGKRVEVLKDLDGVERILKITEGEAGGREAERDQETV